MRLTNDRLFPVHPASAYTLEKKTFYPLDEIRADTKVRPYKNSLTLALSRGEGIRGLITPANPIEQQPDMLKKKYALAGCTPVDQPATGFPAMDHPRTGVS